MLKTKGIRMLVPCVFFCPLLLPLNPKAFISYKLKHQHPLNKYKSNPTFTITTAPSRVCLSVQHVGVRVLPQK